MLDRGAVDFGPDALLYRGFVRAALGRARMRVAPLRLCTARANEAYNSSKIQKTQDPKRGGFMLIPRLSLFPALALLLSLGVAPMRAQSAAGKNSASAEPQLDGLTAPVEFRPHVPSLPQTVEDRLVVPPLLSASRPVRILRRSEQDDDTCYYIRSYRVTRDDPGSDETRRAGYTTCQPGSRFQTKTAVDTKEIGPRLTR